MEIVFHDYKSVEIKAVLASYTMSVKIEIVLAN